MSPDMATDGSWLVALAVVAWLVLFVVVAHGSRGGRRG